MQVKEQSICVLWNLSVDEKLRIKIANTDILPLLSKNLDDEDMKVKEAAGGVLANLALSPCNHGIIVESGLISKLVRLLFAISWLIYMLKFYFKQMMHFRILCLEVNIIEYNKRKMLFIIVYDGIALGVVSGGSTELVK